MTEQLMGGLHVAVNLQNERRNRVSSRLMASQKGGIICDHVGTVKPPATIPPDPPASPPQTKSRSRNACRGHNRRLASIEEGGATNLSGTPSYSLMKEHGGLLAHY